MNLTTQQALTASKIGCMAFLFALVVIVGNIPLRSKTFKSNQVLLACTAAFSGGLFLSVGLFHLLYESNNNIVAALEPTDSEPFPYSFLIAILSFASVLWIEKVAVSHQHEHKEKLTAELSAEMSHSDHGNHSQVHIDQVVPLLRGDSKKQSATPMASHHHHSDHDDTPDELDHCTNEEEQKFRAQVSVKLNVAKKITHANEQIVKKRKPVKNSLKPYILQVAVGLHAVLEGLSIGIENRVSASLGLAFTVACHKWAEGLTLGIAFKQAGVETSMASTMILIQGCMNPIGIGIGWMLSSSGLFVTGVFYAISAGTFLYISTVEVIVVKIFA